MFSGDRFENSSLFTCTLTVFKFSMLSIVVVGVFDDDDVDDVVGANVVVAPASALVGDRLTPPVVVDSILN